MHLEEILKRTDVPEDVKEEIRREIAERKLEEDFLRSFESKYNLLVENLNSGLWQIDNKSVTTFVNSTMASMLGKMPTNDLMATRTACRALARSRTASTPSAPKTATYMLQVNNDDVLASLHGADSWIRAASLGTGYPVRFQAP